jgi:magnesium-transporting ATPase (P-type)
MSEGMSFREKSAWVCFITTLIVWIPYFAYVVQLFQRGELSAGPIIAAFIGAVVFQTALGIVAFIAIAIRSRQEPKDERDMAIESKGYKNAYFVLAFACLFAISWIIVYAVAAGPESAARLLTPTAMSQMLLFCFVAAEATRYGTQAISYRRGS